uniref:Uncharacterized protein LOC110193423 n=1 Tax=Phascolarctos cinereus TaxID=38626 RepID=A0A6P5IFT4_PHACI|nr:uncharacterized protein LOC110193423 [Phascolarctos cinereus]
MEKETVHRQHRLIPGVSPAVAAPGLHKVVTEASELQRSKSVGGFPPTREPVTPIEKLLQEFVGKEKKQINTSQHEEKRDTEKENCVLERNTTQAVGKELESLKLDGLLETETNLAKPPVAFVEIDLEEHTEEKIESTLTEEKSSKAEAGDTSEDESKTMWMCCFPISSKKKSKEKA